MPPRRRARRTRRKNRKAQNPMSSAISMLSDKGQYAHIKETLISTAHAGILPNVDIESSFNLAQYPRAFAMSSLFKFYRAKRVVYTYTPFYNTFQEGAGAGVGGPAKPQMYCAMNRSGDLQPFTLAQVLELGVKPIPFSKNLQIAYKPNWLIGGLANGESLNNPNAQVITNGAKVSYDWLPTASIILDPGSQRPPSLGIQTNINTGIYLSQTSVQVSPTYQGHRIYISQPNAPVNTAIALETITVEWEFKGANPGLPLTQEPKPPAVEV
jgi:hypothetical protein